MGFVTLNFLRDSPLFDANRIEERYDAMREAARQEGKALALLGELEEFRGGLAAQRTSQDRVAKVP